jgi:hypothetical protein
VSYDKLAVRYRRWRNDLDTHEQLPARAYASQSMDAGDLFALDREQELSELPAARHSSKW